MHIRHVVPFLLLFAWQVAPDPGLRDRPSRFKLWLGGGGSSFDLWEVTTCDGSTYMEKESRSGWGIQADGWPAPTVRVSGAYARTEGRDQLAGMVAWEGSFAGLGAGWAGGPDRLGESGPSAYFRLGPVDHAHLRAEMRSPTPLPGVAGWARAGLAGNMGQRRGGSFFAGVAVVKACRDDPCPQTSPPPTADRLAAFLEAELPLGRSLGVFGRFHVGPSTRGFALGASLRL